MIGYRERKTYLASVASHSSGTDNACLPTPRATNPSHNLFTIPAKG